MIYIRLTIFALKLITWAKKELYKRNLQNAFEAQIELESLEVSETAQVIRDYWASLSDAELLKQTSIDPNNRDNHTDQK